MTYYVYILASKPQVTVYISITNDLIRRIHEHLLDAVDGFTKKYGIHHLVYFEASESIEAAILREKQLKKWEVAWKIQLIEGTNPDWHDLFPTLAT